MFRFEIRHMMIVVVLMAMVLSVQRNIQSVTIVYCVFLCLIIPFYFYSVLKGLRRSPEHARRALILALTMLLAALCAVTVPDFIRPSDAAWMPGTSGLLVAISFILSWRARRFRRWLSSHVSEEAMPQEDKRLGSWRLAFACFLGFAGVIFVPAGVRYYQALQQVRAEKVFAGQISRSHGSRLKLRWSWDFLWEDPRFQYSAVEIRSANEAQAYPWLRPKDVDVTCSDLDSESLAVILKAGGIRGLSVGYSELPDHDEPIAELTNVRIESLQVVRGPQIRGFVLSPKLKFMRVDGPISSSFLRELSNSKSLEQLHLKAGEPLTKEDVALIAEIPKLKMLSFYSEVESLVPLTKSRSLQTFHYESLGVGSTEAVLQEFRAATAAFPLRDQWTEYGAGSNIKNFTRPPR